MTEALLWLVGASFKICAQLRDNWHFPVLIKLIFPSFLFSLIWRPNPTASTVCHAKAVATACACKVLEQSAHCGAQFNALDPSLINV